MACTASKTPLFRSLAARGYSVSAQAATKVNSDVQQTVLPSKLVVATAESDSPLSRISILFKAGSRYESYDNLGVSHTLRIAAGLSTQNATGFGIMRNIQQIGGTISCTSDREIFCYTLDVTRNNLEIGMQMLQNAVTNQVFKPWEIEDNLHRIKVDLANIPKQVKAVELLHNASYHTGLGNSLFMAKHRVGKLSSETLQHYFENNFTSNRAAVIGVGIDHQLLQGFAQNLKLNSGNAKETPSKFHSSEMRKEKGGSLAHVAIATEGSSMQNMKDVLSFAVLQFALGHGSAIKRGTPLGGIEKAVASVSNHSAVQAFNVSYSDSGLFGFVLSAPGKDAGKSIDAALKVMKSGKVPDQDIARAKTQLKTSVLHNLDQHSHLIEEMGMQGLISGNIKNISSLIAEIDSVTSSDVQKAASKVASGKVSIGAVGNLETVPYLSQLN